MNSISKFIVFWGAFITGRILIRRFPKFTNTSQKYGASAHYLKIIEVSFKISKNTQIRRASVSCVGLGAYICNVGVYVPLDHQEQYSLVKLTKIWFHFFRWHDTLPRHRVRGAGRPRSCAACTLCAGAQPAWSRQTPSPAGTWLTKNQSSNTVNVADPIRIQDLSSWN